MPRDALALALAAAVLHAGWNVLLRGSEDVEARTAVVLALSVVLFAPVAAATWSVSWSVWPYVAASAAFEGVYFALLVAAYRRRELSVVYPVARGSAPVLVLLGTAVVVGRHVSPGEAGGVCLVASCSCAACAAARRGCSSGSRSAARSPRTRSWTRTGSATRITTPPGRYLTPRQDSTRRRCHDRQDVLITVSVDTDHVVQLVCKHPTRSSDSIRRVRWCRSEARQTAAAGL